MTNKQPVTPVETAKAPVPNRAFGNLLDALRWLEDHHLVLVLMEQEGGPWAFRAKTALANEAGVKEARGNPNVAIERLLEVLTGDLVFEAQQRKLAGEIREAGAKLVEAEKERLALSLRLAQAESRQAQQSFTPVVAVPARPPLPSKHDQHGHTLFRLLERLGGSPQVMLLLPTDEHVEHLYHQARQHFGK
jgi:hypothetical protein